MKKKIRVSFAYEAAIPFWIQLESFKGRKVVSYESGKQKEAFIQDEEFHTLFLITNKGDVGKTTIPVQDTSQVELELQYERLENAYTYTLQRFQQPIFLPLPKLKKCAKMGKHKGSKVFP